MNPTVELHFGYWSAKSSDVVVSTWTYLDGYFAGSKLTTSSHRQPAVFKRKFFEVPERLYELIMGHCIRSGDRAFNLNDVYSAAQSFNARMTINGADIRAAERIPTLDLLNLVTAVYCIAFRERYLAGKVIEAFTTQEKKKISFANRVFVFVTSNYA